MVQPVSDTRHLPPLLRDTGSEALYWSGLAIFLTAVMECMTESYLKEEGFISVQGLRVEFITVSEVVLCDRFLLIGPCNREEETRNSQRAQEVQEVTRPTGLLPEVAQEVMVLGGGDSLAA